MEAAFVQELQLILCYEEMQALKSLVTKLKEKPGSVGFNKKDFTDQDNSLIDSLNEIFEE